MAYIGTQPKDVRSFGKAQFDFTATASQTVFSGADDDGKTLGFTTGQIQLYVNGILMDASDYTTSNGNTVTLASAANANDIITVVALQTDIPNSDYVPATGGTFSGAVTHTGNLSVDGGTIKLDGNYPVGIGNVALGDAALNGSLTGGYSTAVGTQALTAMTSGNGNTGIGFAAGDAITSGSSNVAVGTQALTSNTTASNNTAVGYQAGYNTTTGSRNVSLGTYAGYGNTTSYDNVSIGFNSQANTTGGGNIAIGSYSLDANTTGNYNVAVGTSALSANTTASNNTAVGYQAGYNLTTSTTSDNNTMIGGLAGYSANFAINNTYVGYGSGYLMTTGDANTIIGRYNGNQGGLDITTSSNNIVLSDGDGNPRLVFNSAGSLAISANNADASQASPLYGFQIDNTADRTFVNIGHPSGTSSGYGYIRFHYNGGLIGQISQNGTTAVQYLTSSDYRLKENVVELTGATERLKQIPVHRFNFINDPDDTVDGFLAHEVQAIVPEAIHGTKDEVDADGNPVYQGIDQSKLVPLLVATIKELEARITALENP